MATGFCGSVAYLCRCATGSAIFAASWGVDGAAGTTLGLWSLAHCTLAYQPAGWSYGVDGSCLAGYVANAFCAKKIKGRAEGKVKRQAKAKPIAWSHRELDCCRAVVALWARQG